MSSVKALTANFVSSFNPKATIKVEGWLKPPPGFVKLNVDAAFNQDLLLGAAGAVLRDPSGNFIAAANWKIDMCADALSAEAMALRWCLSLAQTVGCNKLIINSDNLEVVETMKNGGRSMGIATAIFDDCYNLACEFPRTVFEHCNRLVNGVAHELARMAMRAPEIGRAHV